MDAVRDWIAPAVLQGLKQHLHITTEDNSPAVTHIEDDLSNLYIRYECVESIQLVQVCSTPSARADLIVQSRVHGTVLIIS